MTTGLLADRSLSAIAQYLSSQRCDQNVFVLAYPQAQASQTFEAQILASLAELNLPYPEAVFDIHYFQYDPQPFYTLARDLAPGKFVPTPTHAFIRLLHAKGKLHTCFTQNIDTLERLAGVPPEKVVEAHGSFASSRCIECKAAYDDTKMKQAIADARVPRCEQAGCGGLVKPNIVFFGESLPPEFTQAVPALRTAALVIIMGTSLKVRPFAMLPDLVPREGCPRLLLNLEPAGNIGVRAPLPPSDGAHTSGPVRTNNPAGGGVDSEEEEEAYCTDESQEEREEQAGRQDDVVYLGDCDKSVRELCDLLGWRDELEQIWKALGGGTRTETETGTGTTATATAIEAVAEAAAPTTNPTTDAAHGSERRSGDDRTAADVNIEDRVASPVNDVSPHEHDEAAVRKGPGSIEPDESARKWQRDQSENATKNVPEGTEGRGDLAPVKDSSVEKTLEVIVKDLGNVLDISDKGAEAHNTGDR